MTTIDAATRFTEGDWAQAGLFSVTALRDAGEIVQAPNYPPFWYDRTGHRYTLSCLQSASWQARYSRETAARLAKQDEAKQRATNRARKVEP